MRSEDATGPGLPQVRIRLGSGEGVVLDGDGRPFHDALARPALPDEVRAWLERARPERAALDVGELALARGVPLSLDAAGFGRHTFLCGQSGSGKTYSLGVLLERLLMETSLRVVVLDPNSDYVRLAEARPGADREAAERFRPLAESIAVRRGTDGPDAIRVRFRELSPAQQAALLRLDPLTDREEYAELIGPDRGRGHPQPRGPGEVSSPRRSSCAATTWASTGGASGPARRVTRWRPASRTPTARAAPSSTSDRWRRARSRPRSPATCSTASGGAAPRGSRWRS